MAAEDSSTSSTFSSESCCSSVGAIRAAEFRESREKYFVCNLCWLRAILNAVTSVRLVPIWLCGGFGKLLLKGSNGDPQPKSSIAT